MTSKTDERVLVIPAMYAIDVCRGFSSDTTSQKLAADLINSDQLRFMPRSQVEDDPEFLQLIPYVILHRYEPSQWFGDKFQVFNYRRGSAGGESRLIGKRSIGIGGHVNDSDGMLPRDAFRGGVWREIDEEVYCSFDPVGSLIGTIYDDTDAVGRVHFGIVISFRVVGSVIVPKDKSLTEPRIYSLDTLVEESTDFENWSRLVINNIPSARHDSPTPFGYCQPFVLDPLYGSRIITTN